VTTIASNNYDGQSEVLSTTWRRSRRATSTRRPLGYGDAAHGALQDAMDLGLAEFRLPHDRSWRGAVYLETVNRTVELTTGQTWTESDQEPRGFRESENSRPFQGEPKGQRRNQKQSNAPIANAAAFTQLVTGRSVGLPIGLQVLAVSPK